MIDLVSLGWLALRSILRFHASPDIRILVYHDIADLPPSDDPLRISTSPGLFEQQIRFLRDQGYRFLSVEEAAACIADGKIPKRGIVVTFDDAHASILTAAALVLKRYAVPATLFVPVGWIGEARFPWIRPGNGFSRPMTWDELGRLAGEVNLEIGSHTMTHQPLHILSRAEQESELDRSRRVLEERLGRPVRVFAYPFGGWDTFPRDLYPLLQAHGYVAACTNVMGANHAGTHRMALRRIRVGWCDSLWRFRLKLAGDYDWSDRARRILASLRSRDQVGVESLGNT